MHEDDKKLSTRDIVNASTERRDAEAARIPTDSPAAAVQEAPREVLFPSDEVGALRTRWEAIQTGFVDEPKTAVTEADALVAQVMTRLAEVFSEERTALEKQWDRGDSISTEDLRIALRKYRSFFDRLLAV
jgi:hypothetical protein